MNGCRNIVTYKNDRILAGTTMRDPLRPESNNTALHICKDPQAVLANRRALAEELGIPMARWALPWQKHTANIARVTADDRGRGTVDVNTSIMNTDALYTTEPGILIGVFTADCIGLILIDETTPCIAVIHSGWRGTAQAITDACLKELTALHLLHPQHTAAYFSPSLQYDSLEVGLEVPEQMKHLDTEGCIRYTGKGKAYIDNQGINIKMLKKYGITDIHPSSLDTKTDETCFSYRRDGIGGGEHFTFAYIKEAL
ncbi:polyphenol oxidase family protein [Catenisphaera adipataccumulans]|uniref:Purine nucleoside phosphorylase n=1 Tax=Catenisphaera adipataccumulans TaxID=700500 RepID=A0A7W8D0P0_9FIRM|nr:polyphenol oxidase family protein [Catenisphaera adipataccumulans]MBB5183410.1 hypothetical protein [Catenisphaera adipataccumulans]